MTVKLVLIPVVVCALVIAVSAFVFLKEAPPQSPGQQTGTPTLPPSALVGSLIQPSNLEYKGAFRLPAGVSETIGWEWGGSAMAYYPSGDSSGASDGYPGSIFGAGHNQTHYISEISIPAPAISSNKSLSDLNTATTLGQFTNVRSGISALEQIYTDSALNYVGMEYLPAQGSQTSGKLYLCWAAHFQDAPLDVPSHMWCDTNLTNQQGSWRVLDNSFVTLYSTNNYMFEIPANVADNYFSGRRLATGRYRDGGWGGMGPNLFAVAPWASGNPPAAGTTLPTTTLLRYASTHQEGYQYVGNYNYKMDNYQHSDEWVGGAWLTVDNRSAVIFMGTKGTGSKNAWYGYPNGLVWPDEAPFPSEPSYPFEERGWWTESFEARILFYNPLDLIAVANGSKQPHEPQPYASMSIDNFLFNIDKMNHPDFADSLNKYRISACSYDRSNQLLYIFEYRGDSETDRPLCHVFKIN
ncbi:MAG: hypothetical protein AB1305_04755 [Candidatus Hadarchaeota archaeon]